MLNLVKQEMSTLKTEGDCVITDLLISEPTGVAKYEIIPESPNVSCNDMSGSDCPFKNDNSKPLTDAKYMCNVCDVTTRSQLLLHIHKSKVHKQIETMESSAELPCHVENRNEKSKDVDQIDEHVRWKTPKPFKCESCEKSFTTSKYLRKHIKYVHLKEPKPFRCETETCDKSFRSAKQLGEHIKYVHMKEPRPFKCGTCEKLFSYRSSLLRHKKYVHFKGPKSFKCETCEKSYKTPGHLKRHIKYGHLNEPKPFGCETETCDKSFRTPRQLREHIKYVHLKEPKLFKCETETCDRSFIFARQLREHIKYVHLKEPKLFRCETGTCDKSFRFARQLREHIKYVHLKEPKRFKCETCEKLFQSPSHLSRHTKFVHGEPKPCPHCGKFVRELKNHIEWVHCDPSISKRYKYWCSICKKKFKSLKDLTSHERLHWAIRPYACSECEFATHKKIYLDRHIQRLHKKSDDGSTINQFQEKSLEARDLSGDSRLDDFTCKDCSESFNSEIELDLHKISTKHNQIISNRSGSSFKKGSSNVKAKSFQCSVCHQMFVSRYSLERHQMIHTREKVSCSVCNKIFTSKANLKKHTRTQHSSEDSAVSGSICTCQGCSETFSDEKVLKKHMKYCVHL